MGRAEGVGPPALETLANAAFHLLLPRDIRERGPCAWCWGAGGEAVRGRGRHREHDRSGPGPRRPGSPPGLVCAETQASSSCRKRLAPPRPQGKLGSSEIGWPATELALLPAARPARSLHAHGRGRGGRRRARPHPLRRPLPSRAQRSADGTGGGRGGRGRGSCRRPRFFLLTAPASPQASIHFSVVNARQASSTKLMEM